jgi:putative spermidine/putrescine transport system substrate-binding protein
MRRAVTVVLLALLVASACSKASEDGPTTPRPITTISTVGDSEGELDLLAFAGYVEDGSSDPDFDWVHPFEHATGCSVHVRYVDSGPEMLHQLSRGGDQVYDGASVSGDVAGLLIRSRRVAAVDPALFRHEDELLEPLRGTNASHVVEGTHVFGTPALYGPNLLLYDTRAFETPPTSWSSVLEPAPGDRVAMLDSPMALADAALYLSVHEPDLGIDDPYALTPTQLDAAAGLLEAQVPFVRLYWTAFTDLVDAFRADEVDAGVGWPIALSLLGDEGDDDAARFDGVVPTEGLTGWADTWMVTTDAPHPNCMIRWMRWTMNAEVQADMALWYGAAPSNGKACRLIRADLGSFGDLVDTLRFGRCGDEEFLSSLHLWRVPSVECGDDRGRECAGYPAWLLRWSEIRDRG